ncbi:MAG: fibronectin type III domain-containing protein [Candidatus Thermoplasmatota archaeon]|nr:fibronectin type III domain-containing protein [Candidatus Thermoplasmatota archaeon]
MVVTIEGSTPVDHWYTIDLLIVNLSSSNGRVIIQNPSQERYDLLPPFTETFQWSVTGNSTGADSLSFDLYAFNAHSNQSPNNNINLVVRDQYSYFVSVTLPQSVSTPPQNLISNSGDGFVQLSWDAPASDGNASITEYSIHRGTSSGGEILIDSVSGISFSYNDTDITNGVNYYYYVTANNAAGESDPSNEVSELPLGPPTLPRNLVGEGGDAYVQLSWDASVHDGGQPITEYRIFRGTEYGGETYLDSASPDNTSYNDTGLTNGITYYHIVTAINSMGESEPSIGVATTSLRDVTTPSPPQNLEANTGNGFVELSWKAPEDDGGSVLMGYKIYRGTSPDNETYLDSEIGFTISHNDTTVTNGETYYYYVTALNPLGESESSNITIEKPRGPPEPPLSVHALSGNGFVKLVWEGTGNDGGLNLISYNIYRGNTSDDLINISSVDPITHSYNDSSVTNGITYYYVVTAANSLWEGTSSSIVKAVPQSVPTSPRNLRATLGKGYVDISWKLPLNDGGHNIVEYNIYRGLSQGTEVRIGKVNSILTIYRDPTIFKGTYYYYVTATNLVGESPNSNNVNLTLSVKEDPVESGFPKISSFYPEDENVHVNENDVVVLNVESDGDSSYDWYIDNESYTSGISTLYYPAPGPGDHFIRLRITNETSGLSKDITWNIIISENDVKSDVPEDGKTSRFLNFMKDFILFGGIVILGILGTYLAIFYKKKRKEKTKGKKLYLSKSERNFFKTRGGTYNNSRKSESQKEREKNRRYAPHSRPQRFAYERYEEDEGEDDEFDHFDNDNDYDDDDYDDDDYDEFDEDDYDDVDYDDSYYNDENWEHGNYLNDDDWESDLVS